MKKAMTPAQLTRNFSSDLKKLLKVLDLALEVYRYDIPPVHTLWDNLTGVAIAAWKNAPTEAQVRAKAKKFARKRLNCLSRKYDREVRALEDLLSDEELTYCHRVLRGETK